LFGISEGVILYHHRDHHHHYVDKVAFVLLGDRLYKETHQEMR